MTNPSASRIKYLVRQPSLWIALVIWCLLSAAAILFCQNGVPLDRPELATTPVSYTHLDVYKRQLLKRFHDYLCPIRPQ